MDRLDIPVRVYAYPADLPDCWVWTTVRHYHGKRWYVLVPFPLPELPPLGIACLFENAFQSLAYMIEHNCEID